MFPLRFRFVVLCLLATLASAALPAQQPIDDRPGNIRERDPLLRADGNELFFTRPDDPSNKGRDNAADIWVRTRYADGSWGRALNPGSPVNSFAHDQALALNADGTRLVVLRSGLTQYLDLLERTERNWRIVDSWPLPEGVYPRLDVTFDLNGQRLIYSAYGNGGHLDLYERLVQPDGTWSSARALTLLNGSDNTTQPKMAADGRTLYFRQADRWWQQRDPGQAAVVTSIPDRVFQFCIGTDGNSVVVHNDLGGEERLLTQTISAADAPPASRLVRGYLAAPPSPGSRTAFARLTDGGQLSVFPDALLRYEVFLRSNEQLLTNTTNATASTSGESSGNDYAARNLKVTGAQDDRLRLQQGIATREASLRRLDAERRRYDLAAPKETDPELESLRTRYRQTSGTADTLPPSGNSVRDKYARDLQELERMKEKFRRQQEDKLRARSGRRSHEWTARSGAPATTPSGTASPTPAANVPGIGESYTPPQRIDPRAAAWQARQDSIQLDARVRSGLYPSRQPAAYEREAWENSVRNNLPRTQPISPEESARLDAEYQRKQAELAALKAQLQRLNETTPATPVPAATAPAAQRQWSAKGNTYPAPAEYGRPAAPGNTIPVPATPPRTATAPSYDRPGISAGISFITNTAYPDGAGYGGLDQLVRQLKNSATPLEIRVHTPVEMDRRAAQLLSEERAVSIRDHLLEQGIPARMFTVTGFGNNLTGNGGERVEMLR